MFLVYIWEQRPFMDVKGTTEGERYQVLQSEFMCNNWFA